jgi:NADP-dependent 3-hydroxy acid dehydrogenase YdfG
MADRVVVITGASGGIGAALAEILAAQGASLALVARRGDALRDVAGRCGGCAHVAIADVTRRDEVRRVVREAITHFGGIDVWVNNAGQGINRQPTELTDEDIDEMMQINVKSVLYGMQETLPLFRARGVGHVVNVSSMLGRAPYRVPRSAYSASKHFLNALTANFRTEVQATHPGIQYSLVSPGVVKSEFSVNVRHGGPDSRGFPGAQEVADAAAVIANVIDTRRPDVYTQPGSRERILSYYASLGEDP